MITRGSAAATNVGMAAAQGETDPEDLAVAGTLGAPRPVGRSERVRGRAPLHNYAGIVEPPPVKRGLVAELESEGALPPGSATA